MRERATRLHTVLERDAGIFVLGGLWFSALFASLGVQMQQDSWYTLLAGRLIFESGLPHQDTLTVFADGRGWIDQQWLAQVVFHGAEAVGGVRLAMIAHATILVAVLVSLTVLARRRGASRQAVFAVALLVAGCAFQAWQLRAQTVAYGLFATLLWTLVADQRHPTRRTLGSVAVLLVVWANVHGSVVVMGSGFVVLRALDLLIGGPREFRGHAVSLLVIAAAAPFASAYGPAVAGYYADTLFNSNFRLLIKEWSAPHLEPATAAFYGLGALAVAAIARSGSKLSRFERAAIIGTLMAALFAKRNIGWFAHTSLALLPLALPTVVWRPLTPSSLRRLRGPVAAAAALTLVATVFGVAAGALAKVEERYPPEVGRAVAIAAAADPTSRIYSARRHADWLLWAQPQLAGRLVWDGRLELLTRDEHLRIYNFERLIGPDWPSALAGARIALLNLEDDDERESGPPIHRALMARRPEFRLAYADERVVLLVAPAAG
jgi:hypothetical protein